GLYDTGSALRLSMILLGLVGLLLWIAMRTRKGVQETTDQIPASRSRLRGAHAFFATLWCSIILLLGAALPIGKIVTDVVSEWDRGALIDTLPAFGNTIYIATLSAISTLAIAILFTFRKRHRRRSDLAIWIAGLGYAIPGAVIAIGVMAMAGWIDRQTPAGFAMIGTIGLLTYAFTARFLAVGTQPLYGNLRQQ